MIPVVVSPPVIGKVAVVPVNVAGVIADGVIPAPTTVETKVLLRATLVVPPVIVAGRATAADKRKEERSIPHLDMVSTFLKR